MSKEEFEMWKKKWYDTVPRCDDFICCHELTACGVDYLCGDCTIYLTWKHYQETYTDRITCTDVSCDDCLRNYDCKKRKL